MSLVFDESLLKDTAFAKRIDELSEGIQVLREYIFFNRFNFLKQCQLYDKLDTGKLTPEKFEVALKRSPYVFTSKHIQDIINDAPKTRKNEIMYRHMYFLISKGDKPKTKLTAKLMGHTNKSIIIAETSKPEERAGEDYEAFLANFFKTKNLYDFENFDLNLLDTELLQEKNKPKGTQEEISIRNLYATNNLALIENFKITIAKTVFTTLNEQQLIASDDQIFPRLMKYLRRTEEEMYRSLNELELGKVFQRFNITLTIDETNLLYFLIYGEFSENAVNVACIVNWIQAYYNKRLKHIIRISDLIKDLPTQLTRKMEIPALYQSIIQVIQEIGFESVETSLGFLDFKNAITFENLKKFFREYSINYNTESFNELKLWFAQEGVLDLTNKENISEATTFIVADRLLRTLRKTCQELLIPITLPKKAHLTLQEAIVNFNKKVWQTQWKNIEDHVLYLCDSFRMIDEIKIRDALKNMVHGLDSNTINTIFDSFKYNQNISKGSLQRKIFVDELFAKVRDINFDPLETLRKPEAVEAAAELADIHNILKNSDLIYQHPPDFTLKPTIDPADADPKRVLGKLEKILFDLMDSPAFKNISIEEKKIPTLPLLKIFESVDKTKQGYLEKGAFRRVLVESFPIFNSLEIDTLVKMADGVKEMNGEQASDPSGVFIPYYYFLLQIEKYFELNKLCRQYQ